MQGIVDVAIDEGSLVTLLDYKTDRIQNTLERKALAERYRLQIDLYAKALRSIWQIAGIRKGLVFLAAREIEWIE